MKRSFVWPSLPVHAGVYRWPSLQTVPSLARQVAAQGWRFFWIDGRRARNRASLLQTAADALLLPSYFGHNWDAFEECINDLEWAPARGYLLLYDHLWWLACAQPAVWQIARSILEEACRQWAAREIPFLVLLRHTHGCSGVDQCWPPASWRSYERNA